MKKFKSVDQAAAYVDSLPLATLRDLAISLLVENEDNMPKRITISEQQFKAFFKIAGINENGSEERRGRPKKMTMDMLADK